MGTAGLHIRRIGGGPGDIRAAARAGRTHGAAPPVNLSLNESPFGPSARVLRAVRKASLNLNSYPDNLQPHLRERLAEEAGLRPDEVLVTAGSAALIGIAARTLLSRGTTVVTAAMTYDLYEVVTRAAGAELIQAPMREGAYDLDAMLALVTPKTRAVFIANPNNPTGTAITPRALEDFLDRLPSHVTAIIDEAYVHFADFFAQERGTERSRAAEYVRQGRNVVVLRTFSKAYGLAGLRVGYGFASAKFTGSFKCARMKFSVTDLAATGALAALDDAWYLRRVLKNNSREAARLTGLIRGLGIGVKRTWTNFLFIETGTDADALAARIRRRGVLVRPLAQSGADHAIRVTIGTNEQNDRFFAALAKTSGESHAGECHD
jgi:histidinol-phosphate aminotransferase